MEHNHYGVLGFPTDTTLAGFDPEVIFLLQSKFRLKATKDLEKRLIFKMVAVTAILDIRSAHLSYFVSTSGPNAHNQVSIQLDYTGDVQNINSQHFFHILV